MTNSEKVQMFELLMSTPEWAGNVKLPATAGRKVVLLLALLIDKGIKEKSEVFTLFPDGLSGDLQTFIQECLEKAGLKMTYDMVKALK